MDETASYGVKSLQGLTSSEREKSLAGQNDTQVALELETGQLLGEEDILQPASNTRCVESSIDDRLTTPSHSKSPTRERNERRKTMRPRVYEDR